MRSPAGGGQRSRGVVGVREGHAAGRETGENDSTPAAGLLLGELVAPRGCAHGLQGCTRRASQRRRSAAAIEPAGRRARRSGSSMQDSTTHVERRLPSDRKL